MNRTPCPHTAALLAAARSGVPPGPHGTAAAHAATCPECADALLVAHFLAGEAVAAAAAAAPPDPAVVLWRARLERRRAAAERALRPIAVWARIAGGAAAAAVLGLGWIALGNLGADPGALLAAAGDHLTAALPLAVAALLLAVAGGGAYLVWAEE